MHDTVSLLRTYGDLSFLQRLQLLTDNGNFQMGLSDPYLEEIGAESVVCLMSAQLPADGSILARITFKSGGGSLRVEEQTFDVDGFESFKLDRLVKMSPEFSLAVAIGKLS